ncbi:MAG: Gfo/Idh/MocA family protein, partial [Phycisphaeraceae bacterium]
SMTARIGILGFAHGHVNAYCKQWRQMPSMEARVVAGWDHDADRLAQAVEAHQIEAADDASALLRRDDIDAVVVAAETAHHADLVEQAAAAGKAIVMQKPLALTLEQADRMVAAVERAGVPFTMAWQMRVDAQNLKMKRLIEDGSIGRVFMVRRRHGLSTHLWDEPFTRSWHVQPELNRGMWADDAAHPIDFLLWLLGKPASVMAEIDTLHNPSVPDDNGIAIYRYADGTMAEVSCSFTCPAGENTTEIVGERGTIVQNFGDAPSCNAPRADDAVGLKWYTTDDEQWHISDVPSPASHSERIAALAEPLASFLNGRRAPVADVCEGRASLHMTLAAYDSARTGRRITFG